MDPNISGTHAFVFPPCLSTNKSTRPRVIRTPNASIYNLDDDSLLHVFNLCRPNLFEGPERGLARWTNFARESWWYELVKVCRAWRYLILGSASHLGLCLVCSPGTPVAEMLTHSPPFPLIINHDLDNHDLTPEDERGIMFALEHRDRVRRIFLKMPVPSLQKVIKAIDDQFPMLEYLYIAPPFGHNARFVLPATFRAPELNYLLLNRFTSTIGPSLTPAVNLVRLLLRWMHPSTNLYPSHLLQTLSLLPRLQNLTISFSSPIPNHDIQRHMLHTSNISHVTLPNLRFFDFGGVSAYLEALLSHINAPLLKTLSINFFNQLSFPVSHLGRFVTSTENIRPSIVRLLFYHKAVVVFMYFSVGSPEHTLYLRVGCDHLDWQVSSMAQIFNILNPLFSAVSLTLDYRSHTPSSEWRNQVDHTHWRKLLGSFRNVETLRVHDGLVREVSRCLTLDGVVASEILPNLKTLICPMESCDDKTFARFVHDREVAGLPINLIGYAFPAGDVGYTFETPAGVTYVR